ncbi:hypothetical protein J6590_033290 [Homalodisca vitripennis]|nr:hypothetical protein J6590_033290 [Homalodisca vitripennis]
MKVDRAFPISTAAHSTSLQEDHARNIRFDSPRFPESQAHKISQFFTALNILKTLKCSRYTMDVLFPLLANIPRSLDLSTLKFAQEETDCSQLAWSRTRSLTLAATATSPPALINQQSPGHKSRHENRFARVNGHRQSRPLPIHKSRLVPAAAGLADVLHK